MTPSADHRTADRVSARMRNTADSSSGNTGFRCVASSGSG
jgi:hypothetical protein